MSDERYAVPAHMDSPVRSGAAPHGLTKWLLARQVRPRGRAAASSSSGAKHPWWTVLCLTGVDYFSTLSYLPGIALLAAGAVSPLAVLLIVALTLFGVLPMYRKVAGESPEGQGSVAMLSRLLPFWNGKLLILVLLGFVATAWIITITLSSADATIHLVENPYFPDVPAGSAVVITIGLLVLLAVVFLLGFTEAVVVAVPLVVVFLALNAVVVVAAFNTALQTPGAVSAWFDDFASAGVGAAIGPAVLAFPLLALGLSGFETGVTMMPLIASSGSDDELAGRIRNTRRLLTAAAVVMSVYLVATSFVTAVLIPESAYESGGAANGRALAYLAHQELGAIVGTAYDASSVLILWFAGASAMAGLINIVPRYLPWYGMAPKWGSAVRPVVLVYLAVSVILTIVFQADVDAQSGAYATGILAMLVSASIAVFVSAWRAGARRSVFGWGILTAVLSYALIANVVDKPGGLLIAGIFVACIIAVSVISRVLRTTELRADAVAFDPAAREFVTDVLQRADELHLVANRRCNGDADEYAAKESIQRLATPLPRGDILLLEIDVVDASDFSETVEVRGVDVDGYRILRATSTAEPNGIATVLLSLRDATDVCPHCHFEWSEVNPMLLLLRYVLFGHGDTAPVVREILRENEPDRDRRPRVHVGG